MIDKTKDQEEGTEKSGGMFSSMGSKLGFGSSKKDDQQLVFDREIVKPKLGWMTKEDITRNLKMYLNNKLEEDLKKNDNAAAKLARFNSQLVQNEPDKYRFMYDQKSGTYLSHKGVRLPTYVIYDLFNMMLTPKEDMIIDNLNEKTRWQYDMMMDFYDLYLKQLTENSSRYSFLATAEMVYFMEKKIAEKLEEQNGDQEQEQDMEEAMKAAAQDCSSEDIEQVMDEIDQKADEIERAKEAGLDEDVQEDKREEDSDKESGKGAGKEQSDIKRTMSLIENLKLIGNIDLRRSTIDDFVKKSLKMSKSYFSSKYKEFEESIFEAEDVGELINPEVLDPIFGETQLHEASTTRREYFMKFNIYIDCSGSMGQPVRLGGQEVSLQTLCQVTAVKILDMGYVKGVRFFDTSISEPTSSKQKIITVDGGGGTDIESVLQHIDRSGEPALVLTDMNDRYKTYTDNAFFIGMGGANFGGGSPDAVEKYKQGEQFMYFDSSSETFRQGV